MRRRLLVQPRAGVGEIDVDFIVLVASGDGQYTPFGHRLGRIQDEIEKDLFHLVLNSGYHWQIDRESPNEIDAGALQLFVDQSQDTLQSGQDIDGLPLPHLRALEIEQSLDDAGDAVELLLHDIHLLLALR